jgi:hypothetical protein
LSEYEGLRSWLGKVLAQVVLGESLFTEVKGNITVLLEVLRGD